MMVLYTQLFVILEIIVKVLITMCEEIETTAEETVGVIEEEEEFRPLPIFDELLIEHKHKAPGGMPGAFLQLALCKQYYSKHHSS